MPTEGVLILQKLLDICYELNDSNYKLTVLDFAVTLLVIDLVIL